MSFDSDMKKAEVLIIDASEKCIRATGLRIFREIIMSTPVGNPILWKVNERQPKNQLIKPKGYVGGRLRGNWQATVARPANGILDVNDKSGSKTISAARAVTKEYVLGQSLFLTNNLPYAYRVEHGWSHKQRPEGMVKVNLDLFRPEIEKNARAHKV